MTTKSTIPAGLRPAPGTQAPGRGIAAELARLFGDICGMPLPVRLRAWDDSLAGPSDGPEVVLPSPAALRRLLWHPNELGLAQAYVTGELDVTGDIADGLRRVWRVLGEDGRDGRGGRGGRGGRAGRPHPVRALRPRTLNQARRLGVLSRRPPLPASQAALSGRLHTKGRDQAAIAFHYDLSNDFYQLILDESMAYSCAYWPEDQPDLSLPQAQSAKFDLICRKLELRPGQRLLDVGCGWGGLVLHAAENYGVTAIGVTLSAAQAAVAHERVRSRGLADRVEIQTRHYQDFTTSVPFDAVASIEMGEHVGQDAYPGFVARLRELTAPGGRLLLQQASRGNSRGNTAPGGGAFIESFIAPDMHMRPLSETVGMLDRADWEIRGVQAMREQYVRTVRAWQATLEERWPQAVDLVGVETARVWRLYLAGGALAFEQGRMGVDQILAQRRASSRR
ncbi:cyclopropane-fatty-acyl-phospholipid synthase [Catenulispora sp. GP43]|uniref:class I SAM-dependent methyltransferase n=1 Tax=Catenulispora sp. GP43 TaxID=3156263 RepID=UPI003512CA36